MLENISAKKINLNWKLEIFELVRLCTWTRNDESIVETFNGIMPEEQLRIETTETQHWLIIKSFSVDSFETYLYVK